MMLQYFYEAVASVFLLKQLGRDHFLAPKRPLAFLRSKISALVTVAQRVCFRFRFHFLNAHLLRIFARGLVPVARGLVPSARGFVLSARGFSPNDRKVIFPQIVETDRAEQAGKNGAIALKGDGAIFACSAMVNEETRGQGERNQKPLSTIGVVCLWIKNTRRH